MHRFLQRMTAFTVLLVLMAPAAVVHADLLTDIERAIRDSGVGGERVSVSVRDPENGRPLVAIRADRSMIPASNMKLLTSGAAAQVLGPDFRFTTRLFRDGDRVVVVGDGDPAFCDPSLLALMTDDEGRRIDFPTFIDLWIDAIVADGTQPISEVIIDDRIFDRTFTHPDWPEGELINYFSAEVAGLNFHLNIFHFHPRPGRGDRADTLLMTPNMPWLEPRNRTSSKRDAASKNNFYVVRQAGSNEMTLLGNVKTSYSSPVRAAMHDPPLLFGQLLAERLRERGMSVGSVRVATADDPHAWSTPVGPTIETPISTVLTRCNTDSYNLYAEALLKRIGAELTSHPGSFANGAAIVRLILQERLGRPVPTLRVVDGSGLSRNNRVSPATLTAWLSTFDEDEPTGEVFIESLAEAAATGTLKTRFQGVDLHGALVQAKSGYIRHVSCLSGYITMPDGDSRVFSIMVNDVPGTVAGAKKLQERIVSLVAESMEVPDLAAVD